MIRAILPFFLSFGSLTALADEPLPQELAPDQEAVALRAAEGIGQALYLHDQAAAVATNQAVKSRKFKKDKRVKGWITEARQGEIVVTFTDQIPAALYRVSVSEDGVPSPLDVLEEPTALTTYEAGAADARAAALASNFQPCSASYNTVVLPYTEVREQGWLVYLIPGTTEKDTMPLGGTYRATVKGSDVVSLRGFTRTCITLENDPKAASIMITHLLDPVPTEVHVFWSLWANKPLYVATPPDGTIWAIEGSKIRLIERQTLEVQ